MYDIGLPEVKITSRSVSEDGRAILYEAKAIKRPDMCKSPSCLHSIKPHILESKSIKKGVVSFGMATSYSDFSGIIPKISGYQILKDSINLYFEVFGQEKHKESTINRLKVYCKAIKELYKS